MGKQIDVLKTEINLLQEEVRKLRAEVATQAVALKYAVEIIESVDTHSQRDSYAMYNYVVDALSI